MRFIKFFSKNKIERYVGFNYTTTGAFGLLFKNGVTQVFSINGFVLPNPTFSLKYKNSMLLHKDYDSQITLIPGTRREVKDEFGNLHGFYEYSNTNQFIIAVKKLVIWVNITQDGWEVYKGSKLIARVKRIALNEKTKFQENGYDMEKSYIAEISQQIDDLLYPYILSIPILGF